MKASVKKNLASKRFYPVYVVLRDWRNLARHHVATLKFILRVVLPLTIRTRSRPVLFFRFVGMGDIISTFPAAHHLKKRHPKATFIYSCFADFTCLPKMGGITNIVTPLRADVLETWWRFLFTAVYKFKAADEGDLSTNSETVIKDFCRQHGVPLEDAHPQLAIAPAVLSKVKSILENNCVHAVPIIAIHSGPSWPIREWPREAWISLIVKLKNQGFTNIIQLGVGAHSCIGEVPGTAFTNILSLVDQLTLEESIALISLCDLFIGIDSGLLHIAASVRTPGIGIFGPTSPQFRFSKNSTCSFVVSSVECQGCHHRIPRLHWPDFTGCPNNIACMKTTSVGEVFDLCLVKLKIA
jgi:ADP-heptose:LPS heptosyltransferase